MFEFTSSTFFWSSVNFVILLLLVHRFALPAFFKMVDENESKRNQLLTELESKVSDADLLINEYRSKMATAEEEVQSILAVARKEAESFKSQMAKEAHDEKQRLLTGVHQELDSERRKIVADIQERATDLIVLSTTKIIGKEFSVSDHEAVIRESLADFERQVSR
jgi:F-type H+-transporting ATPase subunit b